jgi:dihydroorotate dehydrogenase (fumarate)
MDLTTRYMGLTLRNPLIASASPLNAELSNIRALEDAGAGAVVLPSMFAEQIEAEEERHSRLVSVGMLSSPEASSYFPSHASNSAAADQYLQLIAKARAAVGIPVIASLNAATEDRWAEYATQVQQAGASAIELNIYFVATDIAVSGSDIERRYIDILHAVKRRVSIPVAVKIGPYFSSPGNMAMQLSQAGADALVLFNRFYQPDIDVVRLRIVNDLELSRSTEMRLPLLWLAVLHGRVSASLAATTGVHTVEDVVKYLLAGADAVMTTSALLQQGIGHMRQLVDGLSGWLERRNMGDLGKIRGILAQCNAADPQAYERANYVKILQGYDASRSAGGSPR